MEDILFRLFASAVFTAALCAVVAYHWRRQKLTPEQRRREAAEADEEMRIW